MAVSVNLQIPSTSISTQMDVDDVFLSANLSSEDMINFADERGIVNFTLFFRSPTACNFGNPNNLKRELIGKILDKKSILELRVSKTNSIVVKTNSQDTAKELIKIKEVGNIDLTHSLERDSIFSKFIIRNVEFDYPLKDMMEDLREQGIIPVSLKRFTRLENGKQVKTKSVLVIQVGKNIPKEVNIFYEIKNVDKFLEKVIQCNSCWCFGHSYRSCRAKTSCKRCGEPHAYSNCTNLDFPAKCKNCKGSHEANDPICSNYQKEIEICNVRNTKLISRHDAVHMLKSTPKNQNSYAGVLKSFDVNLNENLIKNLEDKLCKIEENMERKFDMLCVKMAEKIDSFLNKFADTFLSTLAKRSDSQQLSQATPPECSQNLEFSEVEAEYSYEMNCESSGIKRSASFGMNPTELVKSKSRRSKKSPTDKKENSDISSRANT